VLRWRLLTPTTLTPELPMSATVAHLAATLQDLFTAFADEAARDPGFVRRRRKLSGAAFVQALTFGWLDRPAAALDDLCEVAGTLGPALSCQGLDQRFRPPAVARVRAVLHEAVQRAITAAAAPLPLLARFNGTYVFDSSTISLPATLAGLAPGCGGAAPGEGAAACKVQLCLELSGGGLEELALLDGRTNDLGSPLAHRPLPEGALRLADLGFFDLALLGRYSTEGVFWISRLHPGTRVASAGGRPQELLAFLQAQPGPQAEAAVRLGARGVPARLLAVRVPEEVANRRRQRLRRQASKSGRGVSAARLALCDWDVLVTNVPAAKLTLAEVWALRRLRWQVELLFKVWKGQGGIDRTRGRQPCRVLCELLAKLLAMVVQHWLLLVCGGVGLTCSHRRGARRVRQAALGLLGALRQAAALMQALGRLRQRLAHCRVRRRRKQPAAYQLLLDPQDEAFAQGCYSLT
jgi:hypothetical protein